MSLYKELHRPNKSLKFDSPNAEVSFLKSFNLKLASSPSKPRVLTIETDIFNTKSDDFLLKPNISPSLSKKNPIVQDSPVYDVFYKTCFKKSPMGNFTTMGNFDFPKKVLKNGVYNKNSKGISGETTWKPSKK